MSQMESQTAARPERSGGKYIYAVIAGSDGRGFEFPGFDGQPVYTVAQDGIAYVVSDIATERIRPERKYLATHREVLSKLLDTEDAVLPMRFGAIASAPAEITQIITRNRDLLARQLKRVAGKIEMGLRASWTVPNIFDYMLALHSELREARDRTFRGGGRPPQEEMIDLGREFERIQNSDRELHTGKVERIMTPHISEIRRGQVRNEKEIMNLACLIEKNRVDEFETAVREAAAQFDDNFTFEYSGPWAPHSFVDLALQG
jgi:hypothetical protein